MSLGKFVGVAQASIGKAIGVSSASIGKIGGIDFPPPVANSFSFDVTTAGADTFELPILAGGATYTQDFEVDWGDTSSSTITSYDDADRTHSYSGAGTYTVVMTGTCEWFKFNNGGDKALVVELNSFTSDMGFKYLDFYGCTALHTACALGTKSSLLNATSMFNGCTGLTAIPSGLFDGCSGMEADYGFRYTFVDCNNVSLTSIPAGLFRYQPQLTTNAFNNTFSGCTGLTSIVANLFQYNTAVSTSAFNNTFYGCTGLTSIVADLFKYNTGITTAFYATFSSCNKLTSIVSDLFRYNTLLSTGALTGTFINCTGLTSIVANLFQYNTAVSTSAFNSTFINCTGLTSIVANLFQYNTAVSTSAFRSTFNGCSSIATAPSELFKYNTSALSFTRTFKNCIKLQLISDLFCTAGDEATRFAGQTIDFEDCFYRASFTGTQGTAPELWDYTMTSSTKTDCFGGDGNSTISLDNYADIPEEWGATQPAATFSFDITIAGADTFELPILSGGATYTQDFEVDWGDTSSSTITSYDDADRTHSYVGAGTYTVVLNGTCEWFAFNNLGDKTLVVELNEFTGDMGFKILNFYGCTAITTICTLGTMASLTIATNMFRGCTGLTAIPSGLFDNCSGMTASNGFNSTFYGCNNASLTSIPADLFRYQPNLTTNAFKSTFHSCTKLTAIPSDLFKYNISITTGGFDSCFFFCTGLTAIVSSLFDYNTALTDTAFSATFKGSTTITSIPADIFKYNVNIKDTPFKGTFSICSGITGIVSDLFRYNVDAGDKSFTDTFEGCTSLTSIVADIFKYNTSVSGAGAFDSVFKTCTALTTVPSDLFWYNTSAIGFKESFRGCLKMQQHSTIFCDTGDESTRFVGQTINFTECFDRSSFTGTQGTAPSLWDYTMTASIKTGCWSGGGNSTTSLDNYADIPGTWGSTN